MAFARPILLIVLTAMEICIAALALERPTLPADIAVARELQEARAVDPVLLPAMIVASMPGYFPWLELLAIAAVSSALFLRRWRSAFLITMSLGGDGLGALVKWIVARPRPTADLVAVHGVEVGYSFPSGHVVHYVVFFGIIAYLALASFRAGSPRRWLLLGIALVCGALIVLVGPSRVYLGAHWPTDAVGGYVLGSAWLLSIIAIDQRLARTPSPPLRVAAEPSEREKLSDRNGLHDNEEGRLR